MAVLPCFVAGTRIRTSRGEVPVENLREGDRAISPGGTEAPIVWIGWRTIPAHLVRRSPWLPPIRFRRGAFAEGLPDRDLLLSPGHHVFADGILIPAASLVNGATVVQETDAGDVTYYHVELAKHGILLAEGLPAESYLDTGNRIFFLNNPNGTALHPDLAAEIFAANACAPSAHAGPLVQAVRGRLTARALALGFRITEDPDLTLMVDGRPLRPTAVEGSIWSFDLPAGAQALRIVSRTGIHSGLFAHSDDLRPIGVSIARVVLRSPDRELVIEADDPALTDGFDRVERDGTAVWRWTDGNAGLNLPLMKSPCALQLHVCWTHAYWIAPPSTKVAAASA